jgi:hypothetical protein
MQKPYYEKPNFTLYRYYAHVTNSEGNVIGLWEDIKKS